MTQNKSKEFVSVVGSQGPFREARYGLFLTQNKYDDFDFIIKKLVGGGGLTSAVWLNNTSK